MCKEEKNNALIEIIAGIILVFIIVFLVYYFVPILGQINEQLLEKVNSYYFKR